MSHEVTNNPQSSSNDNWLFETLPGLSPYRPPEDSAEWQTAVTRRPRLVTAHGECHLWQQFINSQKTAHNIQRSFYRVLKKQEK